MHTACREYGWPRPDMQHPGDSSRSPCPRPPEFGPSAARVSWPKLTRGALRESGAAGPPPETRRRAARAAGRVRRPARSGEMGGPGSFATCSALVATRGVFGWRSLARMTAIRPRLGWGHAPQEIRRGVQGALGSTKRHRSRSGQISCSGFLAWQITRPCRMRLTWASYICSGWSIAR